MQQLLNVLTPAASQDLVSLEDMKMKLGIPDTDTSKDFLLQELISNVSETIAMMCNRVFAYEEVDETFYQLEDSPNRPTQRLYLSRWPVVAADITSITQDGTTDLLPTLKTNWFLEEKTGTLYMLPIMGPWYGTIDVVYSGGYKLPSETPNALLFAVEALIREQYTVWSRSPGSFGVRQIRHKESAIGYYSPLQIGSTTGLPATWTNVQTVLNKFMRHWV
jgi:hypothetical protein